MELDLWFRWRELHARRLPPFKDTAVAGQGVSATRRRLGRTLIRLGRAIATDRLTPADLTA
jgi:hypothetical protein